MQFTGFGWNEEADGRSLVGRKVTQIRIDDEYLVFETESGRVMYTVSGGCCSRSYFYDIVGAGKLLANGPVTQFNQLPVTEAEQEGEWDDYVKVYGFEIVSEHPVWGEQTTVVSFRNSSNGEYGGWMSEIEDPDRYNVSELPLVTAEYHGVD